MPKAVPMRGVAHARRGPDRAEGRVDLQVITTKIGVEIRNSDWNNSPVLLTVEQAFCLASALDAAARELQEMLDSMSDREKVRNDIPITGTTSKT